MKQGWEVKTLGELAQIKGGKRVPKGYRLEKKPTNHPYIRVADFNDNGSVDLGDIHFINEEVFNQIKNYTISTKDLYISIAGTIGKTGIIPEELDGANLTENACKLVFRIDVDPKFVYYFTQTEDFLIQAGLNTRIAAMPKLALARLSTISLLFPKSLPEQQRIVAILDEAFAAIAKAKANAEQNLKNAKELFDSYLQSVFDPSTCSGQEGDGWEEKTLGEVCELKPQKKEARDKLNETDSVTFLPMEDLGVLNKDIIGIKERQLKDVAGSYTYFADNDVLLAKITPCFENGKIGIARNLINGIGFGSSEYMVFRSKGGVEPSYLYYFLSRNQIREEGKKLMTGAVGHKRVSKDWIENYLIPYPVSLKDQQTIVKKLDALSAQTKKLEAIYQQHINDLDELKKAILQKAFNGELKKTKSLAA